MKSIIVLIVTSVAVAVALQPGFDPKEVVRQVRGAGREAPGVERLPSDDGEFLIDTSITHVPAQDDQGDPAVAFDGTNFLVVWRDLRSDWYDIYGARVSQAGIVLDPAGIAIAAEASRQWSPALAFDGTNFLVVWVDTRSGSDDIYGARVTPLGAVLDTSGIAVSAAPDDQGNPALTFDGANLLVVWQDWRSGSSDIYGSRVTPAGVVLDPAGIAISTAASDQWSPALAFDGTSSFVVWTDLCSGDTSDIYGCRVTPAGVVLDHAGIAISTAPDDQWHPVLTFDGTNSLIVWEDQRSGSHDIYGARVTPAGTVLDPAGIPVSTAAGDQGAPALAFDGASFIVVWDDYRSGDTSDIYGARVTPAGVVLDPTGFVISQAASNQRSPAIAFDGANFLVVWGDYRSGGSSDIYGSRATPAGTVLDPQGIVISTAVVYQLSPALAFDGTNFLVVWMDFRCGDSYDIYGSRVTPAGTVLDPSGIPVSTAAGDQWAPALAFDGTNFLVVWTDYRSGDTRDIYGCRVTPAGVVLDPAGIAISTAPDDQWSQALAFDGTNFLVVWSDFRSGDSSDIYGARVTPAGTVLDPQGIAISTAAVYQLSHAVAFDGTDFLVVWEDYRSGDSPDIYGARVSQAGAVLDPAGIPISTAASSQLSPAVSFDGANSLVVWIDGRGDSYDIYGARVSQAGIVLDPNGIAVSTATSDQRYPALAFDGANSLVVWRDWRSGSGDIYGARVTPAGSVFDSGPVVRQEGGQEYPALARGTDNQMFLVYQGWTGTVGGKTYNTQRIWGKMNPNPAVAEMKKPEVRMTNSGPTIIRGVLVLGAVDSRQNTAYRADLLDISGRKVLDLHPGANEVSRLSPGVYFVRAIGCELSTVGCHKVVLAE